MISRARSTPGVKTDSRAGAVPRVITSALLILFAILLPSLLIAGEIKGNKRTAEPADYKLWHKLVMPSEKDRIRPSANMSSDGKWFSYHIEYESSQENNRAIVRGFDEEASYSVPSSRSARFSSSGEWYVYYGDRGGVEVLNLSTGATTRLECAQSFNIMGDANVIVAFAPDSSSRMQGGDVLGEGTLIFFNLLSGASREISGIRSYRAHPESNQVAYVARHGSSEFIEIIDVNFQRAVIAVASSTKDRFNSLSWNIKGESLAFVRTGGDGERTVGLYSVSGDNERVDYFDPLSYTSFPEGHQVANSQVPDGRLLVSNTGEFVLFEIEQANTPSDSMRASNNDRALVQVWNAKSRRPTRENREVALRRSAVVWWPAQNKFVVLEKDRQSLATLTADQRYAVVLSSNLAMMPDGYELDYPGISMDVYVVDLFNGNRKRILERQNLGQERYLHVSPGGRYIAYFRDENWWTYDINTELHTNVSMRVDYSLIEPWVESASTWKDVPYGSPGWIGSDSKLLFNDKYDVWQVSPDGIDLDRITNGREEGVTYRIHMPLYEPLRDVHARSPARGVRYQGAKIDPESGVVMSMVGYNTKKSGYSIWIEGGEVSSIVYDNFHIDLIDPVPEQNKYIYRRQRFDHPPELVLVDMSTGKSNVLARSNVHHDNFKWGRAELIEYAALDGRVLQGVLYYPAGYQEGTKYPMVVDIYQRQSHQLHYYVNPSEVAYNYVANLTLDGYFVFRPDLVYEIDDPGVSATRCIVSGVEHVLAMGMIDHNSVGLMGHSMGGYATAFIVTQTDLFSAAINGAGYTDIVSAYLGMEMGIPALWRFEKQIFRMSKPYHENQTAYLRNSPIHNSHGINTPLLSWIGTDDHIIPLSQAFGMYTLLRRMQKDHVLLVYPDEGHHPMISQRSGVDLYGRVRSWFDYYLKGDEPADWMIESMESSFPTNTVIN